MHNLLAFIVKHNNWLLFILLEAVSFLLLFTFNSYQGSVWFTSANAVTGQVYQWDSQVRQFFSLTTINRELTTRNYYLERQLTQMRRLYAKAANDTTDAERAELMMLSEYKTIPAKVVSNSVMRPDNLITINRGRDDGVRKDMGVACGSGAVGVVYTSSAHYSIVIPLLNVKHSSISCSIRSRGYFGYLRWDGKDPTIAYVEDIPRHARFNSHSDWIETSGYSSIFPPGILIGQIIETHNSTDGLSYRLKVRLSTDFANLRDVVVLTDAKISERALLMRAARDSLNQKH